MPGAPLVLVSAFVFALAGTAQAQRTTPPADCERVETRPANVPDQQPSFPGQTRACAVRMRSGNDSTGAEHVEPRHT